jgi:hypothetical protein
MSYQKPCNVLKIMQLTHDLPKLQDVINVKGSLIYMMSYILR